MRLAVVGSILVHFAVIAAAYRLPPPRVRARALVEVEIRKPPPVPVVAPLTPPVPVEKVRPQVATAARERRAAATETAPRVVPLQPMETAPASSTPESSSQATVPERKGPVDLTLHGLPSGQWATGPQAAAPAGPAPRKEWRMRGDAGDPILGKLAEKKDDYYLEPIGRDGYLYKGPQFSAHVSLDGSVSFDDKIIGFEKGHSGGTFDLNDLFMRGKHEDPYRYEKEKFLTATAKKRAELAKRAREEQVRQSLADLPWRCDEIWRDTARSARQRRRLLFTLWKDAGGDEDQAEAAAEARATIEKFIRRYLPAGSPDAFTDEELSSYSSPSRHFDPYH